MLVPQLVELRIDRVDFGAYLGVVLVGEPMPELGPFLTQSLDFSMDLFEGSHEGFNGRHARDIPGESSALTEEAKRVSGGGERFANPIADGGELELLARHVAQQLVGGRLLTLRPQLA